MKRFLFLTILFAGSVQAADPKATVAPDIVAQNIFLGQVYPSGNVYLKAFNDELGELPKISWPPKIIFRGTAKEEAASRFQSATFKQTLSDHVVKGIRYSDYLPGVEHMDNGHSSCSEQGAYETNRSFVYLESDFFESVFDYCDTNEGIAQYVVKGRSQQSFRVIAFGPSVSLENLKISNGSEGRPLAPGEADEIEKKKKAGASSMNDCTTVPAYLNEATLLLSAAIAGTTSQIRLSSYDDPGCMGHLATIYVLDVLEDGHFQKRYELHQSKGPI